MTLPRQRLRYSFFVIVIIGLFWFSPVFAESTHSADFASSSSQYLSIPDVSQTGLDFIDQDITFEFWLKIDQAMGSGDLFDLVEKKSSTDGYNLRLLYGSPYEWQMSWEDGNNLSRCSGFFTPNVDEWYHIAFITKSTSNSITMWYAQEDGSHSTTTASCAFTNANGMGNSAETFIIGSGDGTIGFLQGRIDDFRAWSDERTESELNDNFETETFDTTNLEGYWQLDNGILDETANANHLTNNNSVTFPTDPAWTEGGGGGDPPLIFTTSTSSNIMQHWIEKYSGPFAYIVGGFLFFAFFVAFLDLTKQIKKWYNSI